MDISALLGSRVFTYFILPLLIFTARIFDVTLDTVRIVLVSRGRKSLAPVFGFFEILIWLLAITQIMGNLNNVFCYLAYAGGFATGNFVGPLAAADARGENARRLDGEPPPSEMRKAGMTYILAEAAEATSELSSSASSSLSIPRSFAVPS